MPYAPGITDRSGEILAQGFSQFTDSIHQGVAEYRKAQKEKEANDAAVQWLKQNAQQFGLNVGDDAEIKAAVKAMGGGPQAIGMITKLQENQARQAAAKQEAELNALRQQEIKAQMDARARAAAAAAADNAAASAATAPRQLSPQEGLYVKSDPNRDPTQEEAVLSYLRKGGRSTDILDALKRLPSSKTKLVAGSSGYSSVDVPGVGQIIRDNATGEPLDGGKIVRPHEKKSDEKALTAGEIQQIQSLQQAGRDIVAIENAFKEIEDPNWGGPLAGPARRATSMGMDTNISRIDNLVTASTPNLARGVFREVGVLTDADVNRYRKLLPDVNDTAAQRTQKFADIKRRLIEQTKNSLEILRAAGRDTAGIEEKILELAAIPAKGTVGKSEPALSTESVEIAGQMYPVITVRGKRGIAKDGKFYPIIE